jgi:antitoxin StbD
MQSVLARNSIGISELKANPAAAIDNADGPIAVLNRNKPVAYLIPAEDWEAIFEILEDVELGKIVREREGQPSRIVDINDI